MTFNQAFAQLVKSWQDQTTEFKNKWKSYRSKWEHKKKDIHQKKIEEMLFDAGYEKKEKWIKIKKE